MELEYKNNIKHTFRIFIFIIVIAALLEFTGCTKAYEDVTLKDSITEYVINKRTGKIHTPNCSAVSRMSEKNKLKVKDTIDSLLKQDYVICRICRAGIKKTWIDGLFHSNLYGDEIEISASYEDYLKSIDEMSEWYVNHVPTYQKEIQLEKFDKNENYGDAIVGYKEYELKIDGKIESFKVLSSSQDAISLRFLKDGEQILCASEEAVNNYLENFDDIDFDRYLAYYPCNLLNEVKDYNKPGDDCVRYIFAVFNNMDADFNKKYTQLTKKTYENTNSSTIALDHSDVAYGFINLGFEIYDAREQIVDVNEDGIAEGYIHEIDNSFRLKKGDILAKEGHVHIYLGDGDFVDADNFGWGRVSRKYPQNYKINIEVDKNDGLNKVAIRKNANNTSDYYTRVYRYRGRGEKIE